MPATDHERLPAAVFAGFSGHIARAVLGPTVYVGTPVDRVCKHLVNSAVDWPLPYNFALRCDSRQLESVLMKPQQSLPH